MKKFIFAFLLIGVLFAPGCGSNTSEIICDYGTVLCDVSTTMCEQIPGVPAEVCNYLNLACYNLNEICLMRDSTDSPKYQTALSNLENITQKLKEWNVSQAIEKQIKKE